MSNNSRAQVMRDKDDLEEQFWRTPTSQPMRSQPMGSNDPMAELARIVGEGFPMPPHEMQNTARSHAPQPVSSVTHQDDWINEIERAFADIIPNHATPAATSTDRQTAPGMPAWLRSPAVIPQLPVPEGQLDPRLNPEAFGQEFQQELASSSVGSHAYYANDAYQLASVNNGDQYDDRVAGIDNQQWDGAWESAPDNNQFVDDHNAYTYGAYGDHSADYAGEEYDDQVYLAPAPRRRKGLVFAALLLGIGVIGVAGTYVFQTGGTVNGEAPVIAADSQPVKIEPETPGGEEVPNTNKAIYEHTNQVPTGEGAVVVDNREQPVDVSQMLVQQGAAAQAQAEALAQQAEGIATTKTHTTTVGRAEDMTLPEAPEPTSPAIASLGEPRLVRTVSVRPDGSMVPTDGPIAPAAPTAEDAPGIDQLASAIPAVASPATPSVSAATAPTVDNPAVSPAVGPVPRPAAVNRPSTRAPLQLGPTQTSPQPPMAQTAMAPVQATPAVSGSYTVQLAAPGSEKEARNLFSTLQQRHTELTGYSPNVVRVESGGRTIYRLRVGAFQSRDEATTLCVRIQATGGQCFVARN